VLPALPENDVRRAVPGDVNAKSFLEIKDVVPILVRKSTQGIWSADDDLSVRARDIFNEEDGVHSFFHVTDASALASVAAFMTRLQSKRGAAYFFALPEDLAVRHALTVSETPVEESKCGPLVNLHRHVDIDPSKREALFAAIRDRKLYNFRVDKTSIADMVRLLADQGCLDYCNGPCACATS